MSLICSVHPSLHQQFTAKQLINQIATQVGGKGGGRDDLAEAGGNQPAQVTAALQSGLHWIKEHISP